MTDTAEPIAPTSVEHLAEEAERHPTPIAVSRRTLIALAIGGAILLVLLLRAAPSILTVGLGGIALSLILSFPVRWLTRVMPRALAITVTVLCFLALIAVSLVILLPLLVAQLTELIAALPEFVAAIDQALLDLNQPLRERGLLPSEAAEVTATVRQELLERAGVLAEGVLMRVLGFTTGIFTLVIQLFGILFVAVYLLVDARRIKALYLKSVPVRYRRDAYALWHDFGASLSRYLGGLAFVCVVQGVLSTVALSMLGVPYAALLGTWVAVTAVIPYLGAWLGAIPAVALALFESPTTAILTALLYLIIQQVESNILTPRVQGQAVRVHPILVLLAVIGAGEAAGLAGAVVAVPALAILRVLFDFFRTRLRVQPARPMTTAIRTAPTVAAGHAQEEASAVLTQPGHHP